MATELLIPSNSGCSCIEPQPGFQTLFKEFGSAKCDAERVHRVCVERVSHEADSIRLHGAVDLPEHERDVAERAGQQIGSGFEFADAFRVRLGSRPIPGNVRLERSSRVIRKDEVRVVPDRAVQRIENPPVLLLRWRSLQQSPRSDMRAPGVPTPPRSQNRGRWPVCIAAWPFPHWAGSFVLRGIFPPEPGCTPRGRAAGLQSASRFTRAACRAWETLTGNFVLYLEDVRQVPVVILGPQVDAVGSTNQLRGDAQPLALLADAALEQVGAPCSLRAIERTSSFLPLN